MEEPEVSVMGRAIGIPDDRAALIEDARAVLIERGRVQGAKA
jgi:hypothetical protein